MILCFVPLGWIPVLPYRFPHALVPSTLLLIFAIELRYLLLDLL